MEDDGSALRVGAKYKSFTDLECVLNKFQQDNYVQLYKRNSRKLGTGSKYKNMEVAESAAGLLIYKELDYSCIHGGKIFSSISNGQRPNTRLSKNLLEDTDNIQYGHSIMLDTIFKMAEAENVKDICSQAWLFQILKAIFPDFDIKKSKVKDNGIYRTSVKGLKFVTIDKEMVSFDQIDEFLPNDWNVLLKGDNQLNLCYLSAEKFNGNPIVKELSIMRNGCLKTIGLCHGAYLQRSEPDIFSSGSKCVKEICVIDNSSKFVIRHLECLRVVPISSLSSRSSTCKTCSVHKSNKKQYNNKKTMPKSKEFVSSSESDSDSEVPKKKKAKIEKKVEKKETKKAASTGKSGEKSFQISKNRFVTVSEFRGKVMVGIREFYEADGELKPGKKGISLPPDQWEKLKSQFDEIDDAVKEMS